MARTPSILLITCLAAGSVCCQSVEQVEKTPAEVVQALLDAYNTGNLDQVAALYAETAAIYILPGEQPIYSGRPAIRGAYADHLENNCLGTMGRICPDLHGEITSWQVLGKWVTTFETVTLEQGKPTLSYVLVYEVQAGQIQNAWFMVDG